MEHLAFRLVRALIGMRTEEVALGLQQIRRQTCRAVAVVVAEAGAERRNRDAVQRHDADHFTPILLGA